MMNDMILKKIWSYITFRKQPEFGQGNEASKEAENVPGDKEGVTDRSYLRMMHGINRISIIMFILGMIIVLVKLLK